MIFTHPLPRDRRSGPAAEALGSKHALWALALLLAACFAFGGSARSDVASLLLLRPISFAALAFGLLTVKPAQLRNRAPLLVLVAAMLFLPIIQLVPLPFAVWSALPGRALVVAIDRAAGIGEIWRPMTLSPQDTGNALLAMIVPLAVLVLAMQLDTHDRRRLLAVLLGLGGTSAALGLVQTLGDQDGPLYFYRVTNSGSAVGLFANRNHQGLLLALMLPPLAGLAAAAPSALRKDGQRRQGTRAAIAVIAAILLLPLLLITGSRAGIVAAAIATGTSPLLLSAGPGAPSSARALRRYALPLVIALGAGLTALTIAVGRGLAWERLLATGPNEEIRRRIVPTLMGMIRDTMPLGSGLGSFERFYQVGEPDGFLSTVYMNHAHNDWLELALTGGLAGVTLLAVAVLAWMVRVWQVLSRPPANAEDGLFARLGLVMILLLAAGSLSDYPLRAPALAAVFAIAVLWAAAPLPRSTHPAQTASLNA